MLTVVEEADPAAGHVGHAAGKHGSGGLHDLHPMNWSMFWAALLIAVHVSGWSSGRPQYDLAVALDQGADRVESSMTGEVDDETIRKALRTQYDARPFWQAILWCDAFVVQTTGLVVRPLCIAFAAFAAGAIGRRTLVFEHVWRTASAMQGWWIAGAVFSALLAPWLGRAADTTMRLWLTGDSIPAAVWVSAGRLDLFGLVGWAGMVAVLVVRRWCPWWSAVPAIGGVALAEWMLGTGWELVVQAGIRRAFGGA